MRDLRKWSKQRLRDRIRYIDNAPVATTMSEASCGHGWSRGGGVCRQCCEDELRRRDDAS